ncbi:MAG: hypothetical protein L3J24_13030 [Xanthomonadales bacterium]|nr:hypothetical protein [Xanthomonadales bacterium]
MLTAYSNTATDLIMADGFEALPPIDTDTYFIHSDHLGTPRRVIDA